MGIAEVSTLILIILKLTGIIGWSWWLVLLPEIIAVGAYIIMIVLFGLAVCATVFKNFKDNK